MIEGEGKKLCWEDLSKGMTVRHNFVIDEEAMKAFIRLSGDNSCIHRSIQFAQQNGFKGRVVYGAMQVAHLSYLVGMLLPGDFSLATDWHISFHSPLYINESALLEAEVVHLSEAMRIAKLKFTIHVGERLIASGAAQSKVLEPLVTGRQNAAII